MKNKKPNKITLEAIHEVELMEKGLIESKAYTSADELLKDCLESNEDTAD